jgi:hypothetical protein
MVTATGEGAQAAENQQKARHVLAVERNSAAKAIHAPANIIAAFPDRLAVGGG